MKMANTLTPNSFFKAWVSELVVEGELVICPDHPETRKALNEVRRLLERLVEKCETEGDLDREYMFLDLRNQFLPGSTGSFDGVERALRNLQTSLVMSPNPDYEEMVFEVSKPFAKSIIAALSAEERDLVKQAAAAYIEKKHNPKVLGR